MFNGIKDLQGLFELTNNINPLILLILLGAYLPKVIIKFFVANNIEKLFEDYKVSIVRRIIEEALLFLMTISLVLSSLSLAIFNIKFELPFISYLFLLPLAFLLMFSYEETNRLKSIRLVKSINYVKDRRKLLIPSIILLSYAWLFISFISLATAVKPIVDFNYSNTLELYIRLFTKYPIESIIFYFILLMFYLMFRFLINTPYKQFILLGQSRYKISFSYDNEKYNDYFLLRVNNNKAYICKENTFYTDCEILIFDKDKMSKIRVKYFNNR